eukprot:15159892-Alexandrium_andersonii.AAC.1
MHILYIGCANDACGSALYLLCSTAWFDADRCIDTQLRQGHCALRQWCKTHKVKCDIGAFDHNALGFSSRAY